MKRVSTLLLLFTLGTASLSAATKMVSYKIKKGGTLYSIAHKNHISVTKLKKLNHLKSDILKISKTIKVPTSTHKSKKKSATLAKKSKKYSIKISKAKKRHTEKKLAKALKGIKSQKLSKVKKSNKFALSDILFTKNRSSIKSKKIIELAKKKLGRRYVWGAEGQGNTFDCSGLTTYVCKKHGIKLPRRAIEQSKVGKYVSRKNLKPGDLIFFDTSKQRKGYVNHVGIYIGNNEFIHASSAKKKVIITSLNKPFYKQRFKLARRVSS